MEDGLKSAANAVVDDVINGVNSEINKTKGGVQPGRDKACQRSLLCVLFRPSKWAILAQRERKLATQFNKIRELCS